MSLAEMVGDRVGDYGPFSGVVGLLAVALFFYVILGGPFRRSRGGDSGSSQRGGGRR